MNGIREHILEGTPEDILERYERLPSLAEELDFGALDNDVVVLDTETTGLSYSKDELIQIAAARMSKGRVIEWFVTFVTPGKELSDDIVHLTGITEEDLEGAPSPNEALEKLVEFVGGSPLVAHNADFDRTFVTKHVAGYPLLENLWIDSLDLSRIALPRLKSHRLIDLVRAFGAPESTHRADDDVAATCVVFRILLCAVFSMPTELIRAIGAMAPADEWPTGRVFAYVARLKADMGLECIIDTKQEARSMADDVSRETSSPEKPSSKDTIQRYSKENEHTQWLGSNDTHMHTKNRSLSLKSIRSSRILSLPARLSRKDANDLGPDLQYPTEEKIEEAFSESGILGTIYERYEPRDEQRVMAQAIRAVHYASENLVVEAGTGVGKSMAYLVPSALLAQRNGIGVGVATKTNSLLDQLVYQELPALAEALSKVDDKAPELTWAPLKGISHYPCLRKVQHLIDEGPGMRDVNGTAVSQAPSLAALVSYIEQSEFDDMDSLKIDYRALPRYLSTTKSSECLRRKCPFFGKLCFVHGARRRAETADIVVTNHALLFCDIQADGGLLPTIRHWVIDEAHSTEDEARKAFAETVDSDLVSRIVSKVSPSSAGRNIFERAERSLSTFEDGQVTLFLGLMAKAKKAGSEFCKAAEEYLLRVKDLLYFDPSSGTRRGHSYEQVDVWINEDVRSTEVFADVRACARSLIERSDKLIAAATDVVAYLEGIDEGATAQRDIASCTMDLREVRNAAEVFFELAPPNMAYQATLFRKKERKLDRMMALPLDVGEKMNESFYASTHSVVYTSATLTVGGKFDAFESAVGLNRGEFSMARELELPSSYDFDNNMIVYVVSDMPEPNDPGYMEALERLLVDTHRAQAGSMLTLFTNRREMEQSYKLVMPQLKPDGLRVVCQRYGVSVKGLRDDFLSDEHLSLFALKSFWEGFDAPGATLKGVIIPKLPFGRPTDPLYRERAARDDRAWWHYVLPQAVIETKQAAGRLIRKSDDHGVLILADKRLLTKRYGKTFLRSLQSKTVRVSTIEEIASALSLMSSW